MTASMYADLPTEACERFARMPVEQEAKILKDHSLVDTPAEDKIFGYLAGHYPDKYQLLLEAIKMYDN